MKTFQISTIDKKDSQLFYAEKIIFNKQLFLAKTDKYECGKIRVASISTFQNSLTFP